jgi:hypothetical protein
VRALDEERVAGQRVGPVVPRAPLQCDDGEQHAAAHDDDVQQRVPEVELGLVVQKVPHDVAVVVEVSAVQQVDEPQCCVEDDAAST